LRYVMEKQRIVSGMRPTGALHLGHYLGVLKNWVELQEDYRCLYFVADWHALTSEYKDPSIIAASTEDIVHTWLGVGIDPDRSIIFRQSDIKAHAEFFLLLSMITPISWLERNPTYKEIREELKEKDLGTFGFLGYPVLQAADILVYNAHKVPIGEDQRPHLELTREIARRFNNLYGKFFNEPQEILTEQPKLPGIDGRKMSKSYNNAIYLTDAEKDVTQKVRNMFTDPAKIKKNDRGNPDNCVVFAFHCVYNESEKPLVESECRAGSRGCVDCKMAAAARINESLMPVRERRAEIDKKQNLVLEMIEDGNRRAKAAAEETMSGVRKLMRI